MDKINNNNLYKNFFIFLKIYINELATIQDTQSQNHDKQQDIYSPPEYSLVQKLEFIKKKFLYYFLCKQNDKS